MGPFLFNGLREFLGVITLIVVVGVILGANRIRGGANVATLLLDDEHLQRAAMAERGLYTTAIPKTAQFKHTVNALLRKHLLLGGVAAGIVLFAASNLQQVGLVYTPAGKCAFITAMYIVLVPIAGIFLHRKTHWNTWTAVVIAAVGLYLLCVTSGFGISAGDVLIIACAIGWTMHILVVDHYVQGLSWQGTLVFSAISFFVCGLLSFACVPIDGLVSDAAPSFDALLQVAPELLYAGVISSGAAFTLQAVGQKYAPPATAAILMSLESAFGLLGGVVILQEQLSPAQWVGCALMLCAVILAQVKFRRVAT
jgi:drug/metabolite transporter (DMT)-like permease